MTQGVCHNSGYEVKEEVRPGVRHHTVGHPVGDMASLLQQLCIGHATRALPRRWNDCLAHDVVGRGLAGIKVWHPKLS